ncbi:MAG: flagellar protein FliT [Propionivibrio sp.]
MAEIEELTLGMQEAARIEDWDRLASLESRRVTLVQAIGLNGLRTAEEQATLTRIVENNERLIQRLQDRKTDIGLLLNGLTGHPQRDS